MTWAQTGDLAGLTYGAPTSVGMANAEGAGAAVARASHVHDTEAGFIDSADKFAAGVVAAAALGAGPLLEVRMPIPTSATGNSDPLYSTYIPPATSRLRKIVVDVTEAFDGSSQKLRLGIEGNSQKYLVTSPILADIRTYIYDGLDILMSPTALIRAGMTRQNGTAVGAGTISMFFSIPEV